MADEQTPNESSSSNDANPTDVQNQAQPQTEIQSPPPAQRSLLSEGLMLQLIPVLDQASIRLIELESSQRQLLDSFAYFDAFKENPELDSVIETLAKLPGYLTKLRDLRAEMFVLQERSSRLAKKSIKLQRRRQEDEIQEEIERRKYAEQEKQLAAKVVESTDLNK